MKLWIDDSKMKSDHQLGKAIDFSGNNDLEVLAFFRKNLDRSKFELKDDYIGDNFHIQKK